tara:strand:+ start:8982 stop:10772 length:1791 start_codon:yes stop_codon:yes gene_type:complete
MTYSHPSAHSGAIAQKATGRDDDIRPEVKSLVSAPTFVDNCIHHGQQTHNVDTATNKIRKISAPNQSDFDVTHQRRYRFTEEESSLRVQHIGQGVNQEGTVFFSDRSLSTGAVTPLLLFMGGDTLSRLRPSSIESATLSTRLKLKNMRGRSLDDLEIDSEENSLYMGQIINVGMRTTDIAQKLFTGKLHSLNSVNIGMSLAGPRGGTVSKSKGYDLLRHSERFVSQNFRGVQMADALRFIARHDNYALFYDRFGNFFYTPEAFSHTDRKIGQSQSVGGASIDPIVDVANRLIVKGKAQALNDEIEVVVDDAELQKKHGSIKEHVTVDPTATTETAARLSSSQLLRLNRKAQGSIVSEEHGQAWDLQPGDIVEYENPTLGEVGSQGIIELHHRLATLTSDFQFLSYERGIEGTIAAFASEGTVESEGAARERFQQIKSRDLSGTGSIKTKVRARLRRRTVSSAIARSNSVTSGITLSDIAPDTHSRFIISHRNYSIGDNSCRSAIGTGGTPRTTHSGIAGSTLTVASTSGFPSTGELVIEDKIHASYTGTSSTTFTGVTIRAPSSGTSIGSSGSVRMLRVRGHEMGCNKTLIVSGRL